MNHFFDIGANVGQTFDDFLCKTHDYDGWQVWCFEPSPRHLGALMNKVISLSDRFNITVCPFGFSDSARTATFHEKEDPRGDSVYEVLTMGWGVVPQANHPYRVTVALYMLSGFIMQHTAPEDKITIKLDAEGSEFPILRDLLAHPAALARCNELWVEWHMTEPNAEAHRLTDALAAAGHPLKQWFGDDYPDQAK